MIQAPAYTEPLARHSALWGDQYALTMSQAFFTNGRHDLNTTFHAYIRNNPFNGGYLVTGGQNIVFEWLAHHWRFDERDIEVMRNKTVADPATGALHPLYTSEFLDMVATAKMELTVDAMPEGELAFPDEPIYRIHGPLWQCLMVEGAVLNTVNSQSLFATLASRLVEIADGAPVLEFGLRRAQAVGGLSSTRGAYLGGISGTSNMLAEKYYGIPGMGTIAHAFIMTYESELEAFKEYAAAMPYNGIFLVDTYDTIEGVRRAVKACRDTGIILKGIRLDSGDLTYLSKTARIILDESGFAEAKIAASNDLDEETIDAIKKEGGKVDIWGVGTNLVTSKAQPALGAVYKLAAVFGSDLTQAEIESTRQLVRQGRLPHIDSGFMRDVIKLSEQAVKITIPGELDVLRYVFAEAGKHVRYNGDTIISHFSENPVRTGENPGWVFPDVLVRDVVSVRKTDDTLSKIFPAGTPVYRPVQPVFKEGSLVARIETVHRARDRAREALTRLDPSHRRMKNPHWYGVGIEENLLKKRTDMIRRLRPQPQPDRTI